MIRILTTLALICFLSTIVRGQYNIDIQIDNYENDSLVVGYYYGDKQLVKDTLLARSKGQFKLEGTDTLVSGLYMLLTLPDKEYVQFNVNDTEKSFKISYDLNHKEKVEFVGSRDNEVFQEYMLLLSQMKPKAEALSDTIKVLTEQKKDYTIFENELNTIDEQVKKAQKNIIANHPNTLSAQILKSSQNIDVPEFEGAKDPQQERFNYYKKHYFDNLDLARPSSLYIGVLPRMVDTYLDKLTSNHPDSINQSIDSLLSWMEPAEDTYRYYLSTFLSKYGKSKVIGYDAIYVHLVDNYYNKGKAPWVDEENLLKIVDNADKIRPALIGKIGTDIKVYKEDSRTPISISDIDYEYLVLLFWAPDCGHCTKMMPDFVAFNELWKPKGVKVFAICSKHQDKTKTCWEKLEEKDMLGFINAADEYHRSRFKLHYNVSTTPKVFILNKDREILLKNIGADQLDSVMREILKRENREDLLPAPLPEKVETPKKEMNKDVGKE